MGNPDKKNVSLTEGPVAKSLFLFLLPLMFGQLLQQLYNLADAWVIGNFADTTSFAAVTSCGSLTFLVVGFFSGLSNGAGVVIARHFGAQDYRRVERAVHTTFLFGILASIAVTLVTVPLVPRVLSLMSTPDDVLGSAVTYLRVYFLGITTVILYNLFMAIMRASGDSLSPLIYLGISSVLNVLLDLLFVAVFHRGVFGAAIATVIAQGVSAALCFLQMQRGRSVLSIHLSKLRIDPGALSEILMQGLPAGIQNSALSLGNVVIQSNINSFGAAAMAGQGAYAKYEGFVFIPIISMSMALATFISQNRGAGHFDRMRRGAAYGIIASAVTAQLLGIFMYFNMDALMTFFTADEESIRYGVILAHILPLFYIPLSFSHASSGILQGLGRSILAMADMLSIWCLFRILYASTFLQMHHTFFVLACVYPVTWSISSAIFIVLLIWQFRRFPRS